MLFIFLLESMQLSWGFFFSSLLFLVTFCVSKRRQGLSLLLLNTDDFPLAWVLLIRALQQRRGRRKGVKLQYYQLCLFVPRTQHRLKPLQQVTGPVQLSLGDAPRAVDVGILYYHRDGSSVTSGCFKSPLVNSTSGALFDRKSSVLFLLLDLLDWPACTIPCTINPFYNSSFL